MDLETWISPEHLDQETLRRYRGLLADDPARIVVVRNFLQAKVADTLAGFLSSAAEFEVEHGLYSVDGGVSIERWREAPEEDRFFRFGKMSGVKPAAALSDEALAYMRFRSFLAGDAFRDYMQALSGIEIGPSDNFGAHAHGVGDFLKDHDDSDKGRRLAVVLYLTRGWKPEHGGELVMVEPSGTPRGFEAEYNSIAVFDTLAGTTHRVEPVLETAGSLVRRTIGGWFPGPR